MKKIFDSFLYGILAAFFALALEILFWSLFVNENVFVKKETFSQFIFSSSGVFLLFSAFAEELQKILFATKKLRLASAGGKELIANSFVAGLGFSVIEIILFYSKLTGAANPDYFAFARIPLFHALTFSIAGNAAITAKKKLSLFFKVILPLTIIHFAYSTLSSVSIPSWNFLQISIIIILAAVSLFNFITANKKPA